MEPTTDPLKYTLNERGFAYMPAIVTDDGPTITVHDSSNAEQAELWFALAGIKGLGLNGTCSVAVTVEDALTFAQQIIVLAERRGIRPDGAVAVDPVLDDYADAAAKINMDADVPLPDRQNGAISDIDGIIELGAFLATIHTAAALAEDIPRRIADLDITAFTQDIGAHLASSAEAAQRRIRDIALGDDEAPKVFPPRPYHLNTAADYLKALRIKALAVAARADAVRSEIECYLDTSTNPEPDSDRAPGCQCTDGNCDKCLHYRQTTESE